LQHYLKVKDRHEGIQNNNQIIMSKTLLLTGASGGIGRALLTGLCQAGYNLALHYNEHFEELTELLENDRPKTHIALFKADLTNEAQVADMIEGVITEFGRLDVVINNAGIGASALAWKQDIADWNQTLATNLTAPMLVCKHALPHMRAQEFGRIINISSVVAHIGMPGTSAYAASKAGLEGYTRSLAKEVINKNITANIIAYGYMNAGMIDVLTEEMKTIVRAMIPAGEFGPTDDILSAILYLANEKSTYVTGQTLHVNGGLFMNS
jgi:NAD(P)-dependent dehydrogenase (short-subunit alcohol dehydrogenase family)